MSDKKPLRERLDAPAAKAKHNGYGYDDLVTMVRAGTDKANMARIFNVSRPTMYVMLEDLEAELETVVFTPDVK